ncbi:hypothetical protein [Pedobacter nutrimenti]|jgi:hypothetical protein|uniref:PH (Pleckstrin Homology) domain-containing protein n=1 Tax=Pedobacter nutrimenti TaxID=1241337 RepID=A0A318U9T9_9SPHI|nr:hypothetical protein [Pedobacter nutrimenti]PYF70742.1 hypothetical protein B0O44_108170 [Pedobacter nutrimenti]|eukprot:gene3290-3744_t
MGNRYAFLEKQYIGRDYIRICIRLVMAAFCFAAYVYERDRDNTQDLFLIVGFGIIGISIILLFLIQYKTLIHNKSIIIDGLWTAKKVKIDLNSIVKVRKDTYSNYLFNNPVYNLHRKGSIRFYSSGKDAIVLTDRDGLEYYIGTQRPNEMYLVIQQEMQDK